MQRHGGLRAASFTHTPPRFLSQPWVLSSQACCVGLAVGVAVGVPVVGLDVGVLVGAFVGVRVGARVGALVGDLVGDWHVMPTSSPWLQSWLPTPPWLQADNRGSLPPQPISSSKMLPLPPPTVPKPVAKGGYPASLHATLASVWPKLSSQTVPHVPFRYASTRLSRL